MPKKVTTESFIQKAREIHGDRYDYSKVEYKSAKEKVIIICKEHGEFPQTPNIHLRGKGCPICGNISRGKSNSSNTEEFIEKARKIHGDKYDYSKVNYINNSTKVTIICPEHGEFSMIPSNHLRGQGCVRCHRPICDSKSFISKAKEIHGNKYDYSKVDYKRTNIDVCIICPEHGEFWQTPNNHLQGKGCPKCGDKRSADSKKKSNEYFIQKAKEVHGDYYNYSKFVWTGESNKVIITCPIHGDFEQRGGNHLCGNGCPKCNQSHLEREISLFLKENNIEFEEQKKFEWLKNELTKQPLSLDFYLPDYNIAIECQGGQHFKSVERFGGEEAFEDTLYRDTLKMKLCSENNINLLYYANKSTKGVPDDWELYEIIRTKEELLNKIYV